MRRDGRPVDFRILWGPGYGNPSEAELKQRFSIGAGASFLAGDKVLRAEERKYKPEASVFNYITWSAYDDNYFTTIFLPEAATGSAAFLRFENGKAPFFFLAASAPRTIFIGPKEIDVLKVLGSDTRKVVRYGMFGFITEILFVSLQAIHKVIPNWGFAIIVLTLIIKILFFPLTYSSSKSMAKMAELQPKIKSLRAKYKKSKTDIEQRRQMNEEMMKLYKEHGINPGRRMPAAAHPAARLLGIFPHAVGGHRAAPQPLDPLDQGPFGPRSRRISPPSSWGRPSSSARK